MRQIDWKEYNRLKEIVVVATYLQWVLDELVGEARDITYEKEEGGFTFDYVLNGFGTVDELLENLNLERPTA